MSEERGRRFGVPDAAVLGAALALAAALLRAGEGSASFAEPLATAAFGIRVAPDGAIALTSLSVALLALGLSGPGPGWRVRLGRPGRLACALAAATLGFDLIELIRHAATRAEGAGELLRYALGLPCGAQLFLGSRAILGAWLALAVAGRWTPPGDWVERAGRWVGFAWLALGLAVALSWNVPALFDRLNRHFV